LTGTARNSQVLIARETVKLLQPNSSVMLNTGTTVLQVAKEIALSEIPLTVITSSIAVAIALYRSKCQVLLTGGTLRQKWVDLVGPITQKNLDEYYVDVLVTGCDGALVNEGLFTSDINLAEIEKKTVQISNRVILVTESHKFGRKSFAHFAKIDEVDVVITDSNLEDKLAEQIRKKGSQLILTKS